MPNDLQRKLRAPQILAQFLFHAREKEKRERKSPPNYDRRAEDGGDGGGTLLIVHVKRKDVFKRFDFL